MLPVPSSVSLCCADGMCQDVVWIDPLDGLEETVHKVSTVWMCVSSWHCDDKLELTQNIRSRPPERHQVSQLVFVDEGVNFLGCLSVRYLLLCGLCHCAWCDVLTCVF